MEIKLKIVILIAVLTTGLSSLVTSEVIDDTLHNSIAERDLIIDSLKGSNEALLVRIQSRNQELERVLIQRDSLAHRAIQLLKDPLDDQQREKIEQEALEFIKKTKTKE